MTQAPLMDRIHITEDYDVPRVINGGWQLSAGHALERPLDLADASRAFNRLIDMGFDTFDCADIYTGVEDFFGDMDFKVGGTKKGITAIQMDLKIDGLTPEIIKEAFAKTHKARNYILDEVMLKAIPAPRPELSKYAPKMLSMTIDPDKIREVIGSGGKTIQKICAECNVKIDIEDDGHVFVSAIDIDDCRTAINIIETIVNDPEVGAIYKGVVTRLMNFGAFVEIAPGKEGLVHISKLDAKRVEKVEDVVSVGDEILVMVTEIDQQGRINLSRKDAIAKMEAKKEGKE